MWQRKLIGYYDKEFAISAITQGVTIGIDDVPSVVESTPKQQPYMSMSNKETTAVTDWLLDKVEKGYVSGPFSTAQEIPYKVNIIPIFTVKKPQKDSWRIIQNCSYRKGNCLSINDFIPDDEASVTYCSKLENVRMFQRAGPNGKIFARDVVDGFYNCPLHPSQFPLIGMKWCGKIWIFKVLPQGLKSAPRIFTRFGDALEYAVVNEYRDIAFQDGTQMLRHYVDDFYGAGVNEETATKLYDGLGITLRDMGVPVKEKKDKRPESSRKVTGDIYECRFGGFLAISEQRRFRYLMYIKMALYIGYFTTKQLEILIGSLNCVAQIIFPAKAMLRRLYACLYDPQSRKRGIIEIVQFLKYELYWWIDLLSHRKYLRISFEFYQKKPDEGDVVIYTDAAGHEQLGVGGIIGDTIAFQVRWEDTIWNKVLKDRPELDIQVQEGLGYLIAVEIAVDDLRGKAVTIYNDNHGAAAALISKAPPFWRSDMQYITRKIAQHAFQNNYMYWGIKIDGDDNEYADALSRFFTNYDWTQLGFTMIDATDVTNQLLLELWEYYPNMPANHWQLSEEQKDVLRLKHVHRLIDTKQTSKTRAKPRDQTYNILTRSSFD